jgi:hypothetical protein
MSFSCLLMVLFAAPNPLAAARDAYADLRFGQAKSELKRVAVARGLTRAETVEFYELSALASAALGEEKEAKAAFAQLMVLEPEWKPKIRFGPKVATPFFEGKALAVSRGALRLTLTPVPEGAAVRVELTGYKADVSTIRLTVKEAGRESKTMTVAAGAEVSAIGEVTATALSSRDWVLVQAGPVMVEPPPPPPKIVETPRLAKVEPKRPDETPVIVAPPPGPRLRPLAVGLGVTGLAVLGGAIAAGVISSNARRSFETASRLPDGTISGITREEAVAAESTARTAGWIANIGFGLGGTLLVASVITWFVGNSPAPASAQLFVGPAGLGVAGVW